MATLNEISLSANGIVRSRESNELSCSICTTNEISDNWKAHVENPQHAGALRQFKLIFVDNGERVNCRACGTTIDWEGVRSHADWHRIVPWYEIQDKYKIFFENRVSQVDGSFDCFPCKIKFFDWSEAFIHISEDEHKKLIAFEPPIHESFAPDGTSYESLVTEGFEPWGATTVKCRLCNCPNVAVKNLNLHTDQSEHSSAKSKFRSNFQSRTRSKSSNENSKRPVAKNAPTGARRFMGVRRNNSRTSNRGNSPAPSRPSSRTQNSENKKFPSRGPTTRYHNGKANGNHVAQNSSNFPVERRGDGRYCTICETVVTTSVDEHLLENGHVSTLRRYGYEHVTSIDDFSFNCSLCKCKVPNLENVYRHIKGNNHRSNLKTMSKNLAPQGSMPPKNLAPQGSMPKNLAPQSSMPPKNLAPQSSMPPKNLAPQSSMPKNLAPQSSMPKNLAPQSLMAPQGLMTQSVAPQGLMTQNVAPQGLMPQNMAPHSLIPHSVVVKAAQENSSTGKTISFKMNFPPSPGMNFSKSAWESLPRDYIVVQSQKDLFCRLCDCVIYGHGNVDNHIRGQNHASEVEQFCATILLTGNNMYRCKRCNCDIIGRDNLYIHVSSSGHRDPLLVRALTRGLPASNRIPGREASLVRREHPVSSSITPRGSPVRSKNTEINDDYIVKLGITDFCCKICHLLLCDQTKIDDHLRGQQHASALKLFRNETSNDDEKYFCKSCGCTIPNFANVPLHAIGIRHKTTLGTLNKISTSLVTKKSLEVRKELARDYIAITSDTDFYCKICNVPLSSRESCDEHVKTEVHEAALEKYGCWNIPVMGDKTYDCQWCDCVIPDFDNIYVHISGKRHLQNVAEKQQPRKDNPEIEKSKIQSPEVYLPSKRENSPSKTTNPNDEVSRNDSIAKKPVKRSSDNSDEYENLIEMIVSKSDPSGKSQTSLSRSDIPTGNNKPESNISSRLSEINFFSNDAFSNGTLDETITLRRSNETLATFNSEFVKLRSLASSTRSLNETPTGSERKRRAPKIARAEPPPLSVLTISEDRIHDLRDKLREIERGMRLCLVKDSNNIYCLICRKKITNNLHNYSDHIWSLEHCKFIDAMEKDHALFEAAPGQFSELGLASQYMEEISEDTIYCHVCQSDIDNIDNALNDHTKSEKHRTLREEELSRAMDHFNDAKSRINCDWYNIFKYWCVPCSVYFDAEYAFARHLANDEHSAVFKKFEINENAMIHDFCSPCAILWYGPRNTYADHCEIPNHKWQIRDEDHVSPKLPTSAKCLLAMPDEYIQDTIKYLDETSSREYRKEEMLLANLEETAKIVFNNVKAHPFGERAAGLSSGDAEFQVFLDCKNMYDGNDSSEEMVSYVRTRLIECLTKHPQWWDTEEILTKSPPLSVKARHRETGLYCDIFCDNGLAVESTKLIKSINEKFPSCREMIIFVKQWLEFCGLYGPQKISSHALSWYVIFYLQRESILPKITKLIEMKGESHLIAGWEVGVSHDFTLDQTNTRSVKELLIGFFTFYANFDYRYDVACPLLGEVVKKRNFANLESLPKEMGLYVDYAKNHHNIEPFRIDCPMCIQNPLYLPENLTKTVSKINLSRFRTYCFKSLDILDTPSGQ